MTTSEPLPEHVRRNRDAWNEWASEWARKWPSEEVWRARKRG